jgi:hypothetical protein
MHNNIAQQFKMKQITLSYFMHFNMNVWFEVLLTVWNIVNSFREAIIEVNVRYWQKKTFILQNTSLLRTTYDRYCI